MCGLCCIAFIKYWITGKTLLDYPNLLLPKKQYNYKNDYKNMTIKKNDIIYKHFKDKYSREKRQPPF